MAQRLFCFRITQPNSDYPRNQRLFFTVNLKIPLPAPTGLLNPKLYTILNQSRAGLVSRRRKRNIFGFPEGKYLELCLRHVILRCKMTGGSKPPPYGRESKFKPLQTTAKKHPGTVVPGVRGLQGLIYRIIYTVSPWAFSTSTKAQSGCLRRYRFNSLMRKKA